MTPRVFLLMTTLLVLSNLCAQVPSSCMDTSFRRLYYVPGDTLKVIHQVTTALNGSLLVGQYTPQAAPSEGFAFAVDPQGIPLWSKRYKTLENGKQLLLKKAVEISGGAYMLAGRLANHMTPYQVLNNLVLLKTDFTGKLLWRYCYEIAAPSNESAAIYLQAMREAPNGDLLVLATVSGSFNGAAANGWLVFKLNAGGALQWSKIIPSPPGVATNLIDGFIAGSELVLWAFSDDGLCSTFDTRSLVALQLDLASGLVKSTKRYCFTNTGGAIAYLGGNYNFHAKVIDGEYYIYGVLGESLPSQRDLAVFRFDRLLNFVDGKAISYPKGLQSFQNINVAENGSVYFINQQRAGGDRAFYFSHLQSAAGVMRQRKLYYPATGYDHFSLEGGQRIAFKDVGVSTFAINYFHSSLGQSVVELLQLQDNDASRADCMGVDTAQFGAVSPFPLRPEGVWSNSITNLNNLVVSRATEITAVEAPLTPIEGCLQASHCDRLKIAGNDTVCQTATPVVYTVVRSPECRKQVRWEVDPGDALFATQTSDTTLQVVFAPLPAPRDVWIRVYIDNGCGMVKDSLKITVLPQPVPLPADTIVCTAPVSIDLRPGPWFKRYRWQDGSTHPEFTVVAPGVYHVAVETFCGDVFRDTFTVREAWINLGTDTTLCRGDTLTITAPSGYDSYVWTSAGGILQEKGAEVRVAPGVTTRYQVEAQTFGGCTIRDDRLVTVLPPPPLNLGLDLSFCSGDSAKLQAPAGYARYQWSTGAATAAITVQHEGKYSVTVTDKQGCRAADTLQVLPLLSPPDLLISGAAIMCKGQTDTLYAHSVSGVTYQWQDGSQLNYYPVHAPGVYSVKVSSVQGCSSTDTLEVKQIVLPPAGFLPPDSTLCKFQALLLQSQRPYHTYLWNTGATTPSLPVKAPGTYWLQVSDAHGCVGRDTIVLAPRDCPGKMYFPSGFTPNGDGKNEIFKPLVKGSLENYHLEIFNRWGARVFSSFDPATGWRGQMRGKLQPQGIYVWQCRYQFKGETARLEKGVVVLIY